VLSAQKLHLLKTIFRSCEQTEENVESEEKLCVFAGTSMRER